MKIALMTKLLAGALVAAGGLAVFGGSATPPAVLAAPPGPACLPEPSGGMFNLELLDPAAVGLDSRIAMQGAVIQVANPSCPDGETYLPVPAYTWSMVSRPAGSTAALTLTNTFTPHFTPDRAGDYRVRFVACPSGCMIGNNRRFAARTVEMSFTAVTVKEGRISSDELYAKLVVLFAGTRVQISHTGAGRAVAPGVMSYVDFGPGAEAVGAPNYVPLPIEPVEKSVSDEVRATLLALQPYSLVVGTDIDKIRIKANNIFLDLSSNAYQGWTASIANGGLNLSLSMQSSHPSIQCEAHYRIESLVFLTWDEGWSDSLCPDFDLSKMNLAVKLIPTVVNGQLTISDASVTVDLASQGVVSDLVDFIKGVTDRAEVQVSAKIREKLLEDATRQELGKVFTAALKTKYPDLGTLVRAQVVGSDLVFQYIPATPALRTGTGLPAQGGTAIAR